MKNKPYFTKYLPVEGEIKEGDKVTHENKNFTPTIWTADKGDVNNTNIQKVKLFLCSRDIQVGDKTNIGEIYKVYDTKVSTCYEKGCTELLTPKSEVFKVIGEISPEATWVKEGMEFGEDEIKLVEICPHYNGKHLWRDCSCKSGFVTGVLIKGPCGHFH